MVLFITSMVCSIQGLAIILLCGAIFRLRRRIEHLERHPCARWFSVQYKRFGVDIPPTLPYREPPVCHVDCPTDHLCETCEHNPSTPVCRHHLARHLCPTCGGVEY